jgi:hypothetical protein
VRAQPLVERAFLGRIHYGNSGAGGGGTSGNGGGISGIVSGCASGSGGGISAGVSGSSSGGGRGISGVGRGNAAPRAAAPANMSGSFPRVTARSHRSDCRNGKQHHARQALYLLALLRAALEQPPIRLERTRHRSTVARWSRAGSARGARSNAAVTRR